MTRRSALRLPTALSAAAVAVVTGVAVTIAGIATAGAAGAAGAAPRVHPHHTARQLADHLAATRQRPTPDAAVLAHPQAGPVGSGAVHARALTGPVTDPGVVFTTTEWFSATDETSSVNLHVLDTGQVLTLVDPSSSFCPAEPKLSPNGRYLTYLDYGSGCSGNGLIDVIDLNTGVITVTLTPPANAFYDLPNWNPDSVLLYTQQQNDAGGNFVSSLLFTVPGDGSAIPTAVGGAGTAAYDGVFSPDGLKIAYAPLDPFDANYLAIMDASGANPVNLTTTAFTPFSPTWPAWSPDGTTLSFTYYKNTLGTRPINGLGTVKTDDSTAHGLTVTLSGSTAAYSSAWSADGSELFYDAVTVDTHGTTLTNAAVYVTDAGGTRRSTLHGSNFFVYTGPQAWGAAPAQPADSTYTAIAPTRLLPLTTVGPGAFTSLQVSGGASGIPSGATAVTLNLTGVSPTHATFLTVTPADPLDPLTTPLVSNLNLVAGQIAAVAVQVRVSGNGYIRIQNAQGSVGVIADISGYFTSGTTADGYVPITPTRVKDIALGVGGTTDVTVTGLGAANPGFTPVAAVLNLTAANPTKGTYLSAYPTPATVTTPPTISNLNLAAHTNRANLVTVLIGDAGRVTIRNAFGSVRTVVDVVGYYGAGGTGELSYFPLNPTRVLDTRSGTGTWVGSAAPMGPGASLPIQLRGTSTTSTASVTVPATAQAFAYNLTAVAPTGNTYLTAYPYGGVRPVASSLNAAPGTIVPNLAITGGINGLVGLYNFTGKTPVLLDLSGYYAPPPG